MGEIDGFATEVFCEGEVIWEVVKQVVVFFKHGPASGGVGDDGVDGFVAEGVEIMKCLGPCPVSVPRVRQQSAAATLGLWDPDIVSGRVQNSDR